MSWVALYVDCVCVDDITNVARIVSLVCGVTSNVTILWGGRECGHVRGVVKLVDNAALCPRPPHNILYVDGHSNLANLLATLAAIPSPHKGTRSTWGQHIGTGKVYDKRIKRLEEPSEHT